jgi:excinuclease ABC subunit C
MTNVAFKQMAPSLPEAPGIYKYYEGEQLIYVGKAKNIKKRVGSYFTKTITSYKTAALVKSITKIDFTITATEQDALFLENSLIKAFQPKYNIDLKDDKTYPWIVIKKEPFPRIFLTRRKLNDQSEYIGPFTSVQNVRELLKFLKYQIPHRNCKLNLSEKELKKKKYKPCLEFHLGNCKAPCVGLQTEKEYQDDLMLIRNIIRGNLQPVRQYFKLQMQELVLELEFEKAEIIKKKIAYLETYSARSGVVNFKISNADIFTIEKEDDTAVINYLIIQNSNIVNSHNQVVDLKLDEPETEILQNGIPLLREKFGSKNTEVILEAPLDMIFDDFTVTVPRGGDKKNLLLFSKKNSGYHLKEIQKSKRLHLTTENDTTQLLLDLQTDLQLSETPYHIECFDNSNLQGTHAVSAMVCFKNAEPAKSEYRHFNVKTVTGINDFATMKEVVYRRYKRLLAEGKDFPELVIIDGGKGQLHAAFESIKELGLQGKITLIGLAKNVEEIFFVGDQDSVKLPYNSPSLTLIRKIRDAVHRFGITHHRNKRSKGALGSALDDIKGIGKSTATVLLKNFKSVQKIKDSEIGEIESLIGKAKAKILMAYLSDKVAVGSPTAKK